MEVNKKILLTKYGKTPINKYPSIGYLPILLWVMLLFLSPNTWAGQQLNYDTMEGIGISKNTSHSDTQGNLPSLQLNDLFTKVDPAVVTIVLRYQGKDLGHGSGFFVHKNGFILTNHHVIDKTVFGEQASQVKIYVVIANGRSLQAQIIKSDPEVDMALLKVNGKKFPVLPIGDAAKVSVGEDVFIIGTPVRLEFSHSITPGIISGLGRDKGRMQTSAILHGGNSGGPAVNRQGEVIGIAVAVAVNIQQEKLLVGKKVLEVAAVRAKDGISYLVPINFGKGLLELMY